MTRVAGRPTATAFQRDGNAPRPVARSRARDLSGRRDTSNSALAEDVAHTLKLGSTRVEWWDGQPWLNPLPEARKDSLRPWQRSQPCTRYRFLRCARSTIPCGTNWPTPRAASVVVPLPGRWKLPDMLDEPSFGPDYRLRRLERLGWYRARARPTVRAAGSRRPTVPAQPYGAGKTGCICRQTCRAGCR